EFRRVLFRSFSRQFMGQVAGLEKALENTPSTIAQIGLQGGLPVSPQRQIGHSGTHLSDPGMDRLAVRVLDRKNAQRNPRSLDGEDLDRKSTRLNSSHGSISYAVFCLKKKKRKQSHG